MLPEILTLKSFLSYREKQVLDFTKFHVALISGENGNGKSSILDAVTFALFSMARGVEGNKKGLGDLVSNGDSFLSISLQFVQDGSRFRIMRTYDKIKRSSNILLQLEKDGDFVNISESTIRETNKKIEDIIHMNYETFITSSFVMQGRSDYFTAKNPTERIEILREMLNLNIYEKAREKVKEKLREAEFEIKELSKRVLDGKEEIKKMPEIGALLKEKEEKIKEIRLKIDKFNKEIESIRKSLRERDKLQNDRKHIEEEIRKCEDDFKLKLKFEAGFRETFERINEILSREKEIRESYVELATVKKSYEEMLEKSAKFQQLVNEKNKIISSVERTISVKKERVNSLKKSLKEFEASIKDVTSKIKSEEILEKVCLENLEKLTEENKRCAENCDEVNIKNEEILKQIKEKEKLELRLNEIKRTKDERIKSINREIQEKEESLKAIKKKIDDINYKALEPLLREKEDNYNTLKSLLEIYEGQSKKLTDKGNFLDIDIKNLE
ncbi:MAG: SMC family ATPase, partial [Caldiserica bacterium]|nr:SMC family ATPase [Caldisericota bacterium]